MSEDKPSFGSVWEDAIGRRLTVETVDLGNRLGRQIQGRLLLRGGADFSYACTLAEWARTWRDRTPPVPSAQQTGGWG